MKSIIECLSQVQIILAAVFILLLGNISGQVNDEQKRWVWTPYDNAFTNRRVTLYLF